MKKVSFMTLALGFASMCLTGCSSDVISEAHTPPVNPVAGTTTVNVKIVSNDFTRSEIYEDRIGNLYLAFYNSSSSAPLYLEKAETVDNSTYSVTLHLDPMNIPDKMIAFANVEDEDILQKDPSLSTSGTIYDSEGRLIMSNAVYFEINGNVSKISSHNTISDDHILNGKPIEIALDRVAAKAAVLTDDNSYFQPVSTDNGSSLDLQPVGWGITATDRSSFLMKQIPGTYSDVVSFLGDWEWNSSENKTSHWAQSVNYDPANSSEDVLFSTLLTTTGEFGKTQYCHESTRAHTDADPTVYCPAILIIGQYRNGESDMPTFYRFRNGDKDKIYLEDEYMESFASSQDIIFTKDDATSEIVKPSVEVLRNVIELSTPTRDVSSDFIPSHFVSPQVRADIEDLDFCDIQGNPYEIQDLNTLLFSKYGILEKYHDGKCVFIVPVIHKSIAGKTFYGLVRNHSYTLTIKNISGFGRGIASESEDLKYEEIPDFPSTYTVNATLTINDWSEITQDIEIKN
ncbi:MAG: fimbria major subunit [Muribaculaceae bacterium]|nr:fimbria major subunit [Muribaculaceae bacterium]